jgi:hypothetical protein
MNLLKRVIARFRKMRPSVEREPQRGVPPPQRERRVHELSS